MENWLIAGRNYDGCLTIVNRTPELLEALRPFANYACDDWKTHGCHNCIAKRAIAKAEGK